MRAALFGLVILLAVPADAGAGPREVVTECTGHVAEDTTGLEALEQACPRLADALEALGVRPLITAASRKTLGRDGLERAVALVRGRPAAPAGPRIEALAPILKTLAAPAPPTSWWDRFKQWLRERLGRPADASFKMPAWLKAWLDGLTPSQAFVEVLLVASLIAVIAGAVAIVVNELRAAGLVRRRPRAAGGTRPAPTEIRAAVSLADVEAAPMSERAALLFRLLLAVLADAGRVRAARARTHRELCGEVLLPDAGERGRFARLAGAAEAQLFGPAPLPAAELEPALADGTALYVAIRTVAAGGR